MKNVIGLAILLLSVNTFALTKSIEVGARINHAVVDGATANDQTKFFGGVTLIIPISPGFGFRTGALYVMKDSEVSAGGITVTGERSYIDIPVTLLFGNSSFEVYGGADISNKVSSTCKVGSGTCSFTDEKSMVIQPTLGFYVLMSPMFKLGAFYDFETEYSKNWKISAFGARFAFNF